MFDVNNLEKTINVAKGRFHIEKGKYENLINIKKEKEIEIAKLKKQKEILEKAKITMMKSAEFQREQIKSQFETMVTNALQFIFEQEIYFEIEIKEGGRSGSTEAYFYIKSMRDGEMIRTGVEESRGDGILDVIGLALDLTMIQFVEPKNNGPLILDEPSKQVSKQHWERVGEFLKNISQAFDRQVIMITHNRQLAEFADAKFEIRLVGNESRVSEISII